MNPPHVDREIRYAMAERLNRLRRAHGLSLVTAAREVGVSQQRWSNYESGTRTISLMVIIKLCEVFGVTTDYLIRGSVVGVAEATLKRLRKLRD
jgi:transcriptional regulator with XRE-family HTH domain